MVHVNDVASLVEIIINSNAIGRFNAASPEPLTINCWAEDVFEILEKKKTLLHIPFFIVRFIAKCSRYRLLAKEQLIMLSMDHVLDISNSINIGWNPKYNNHEIIFDLVNSIRSKKNPNNNEEC
jgi:nucleoside-diphosphate-sugar epimerase